MEPKVEEEYESPDFDDSFPQPSPFDDPQYIALAKRLSRAQSYGPNRSSKLSADGDDKLTQVQTLDMSLPVMDPNSPEFDVKVWAEALVRHLQRRDIQQPHVGIVFRNLSITGTSNELQYQATIPSTVTDLLSLQALRSSSSEKHILKNFEGVIHPGEMLVVLGRPGSGCSTFLKSLCGDLQGLRKAKDAVIEYNGLSQEAFKKEFRGEASYNQEQENHFPHLTVQETLQFAASARTPSIPPEGWTRQDTVKFLTTTVMNVFGLSHTKNTKVGNDFVRGVSGGERKRVSIAEMALSGSPFAAWDNSTRGLDSATALNFTRSLRDSTEIFGSAHAVAIYQASQAIYDLFDKAIVLYKGHQIYFGPASQAKAFFEDMGYICPPRQTTGDFLTSVTNPAERQVREGFENKVPRTPEDFEAYWLRSEHRRLLLEEIDRTQDSHNAQDEHEELRGIHKQQQMKHTRPGSPYVISVWMQIAICFKRMWQRIWNDKTSTLSTVFGNVFLALIIGSIFFNTPLSTSSFFSKGSILFFALLLNALSSITEINGLYEQRPIVEKHKRFAFYHPAAEALAGIVLDIPIKFVTAVAFNIVIYFLGGLTYQAGKFFIFFLFVFVTTLSMSAIFRTMAAVSKTISQALAGAGILVLAIVMYTGFTITPPYQHKWFFWLQYLNPVRFAYEALLANELHGEQYACAQIIPPYGTDGYFGCNVAGAVAGQRYVSGDAYIQANYQYSYSHVWRNFGIVVGFTIFFWATYLFATEVNTGSSSTAEFLIYRRGHAPAWLTGGKDEEQGGMETTAAPEKKETVSSSEADDSAQAIAPQRDLFTWRNVTLDITIKGEPRRLLDGVSGYVKPGTLTALMGVSGAGKTTLLDTLAQRMRVGVLSGEMLVNGKPLPAAFQRNVGYVQQQDLHLETTTVREALLFSANLRQPKSTSPAEKAAFVEEVIDMLGMEEFAEAVVGNPGEGLNIEQRKLLTIGVELAAKPDLLLFLDEPTSGLDSQSSWSIMAFLRKLADRGQTVLSTIHQPSAILFEQFDRLLFLAKGGKTVYFGDIGPNCHTMLDYFQRNGARECGPEENPAEYMLEIVGGKQTAGVDWPANWRKSTEAEDVEKELDAIAERMRDTEPHISGASGEFAMPLTSQLYFVTRRVFEQYWRSPTYIYGKFVLGIMSALFVGFSYFLPPKTQTGVQNLIFSAFMLTSIFSTLAQQIMPRFVIQRSLYEVRERPSKAYSWIAFVFANLVVEIPYHILLGVVVWASWYWPVFGLHHTAESRGLMLLFCVQFFVFTGTFAQMVIAGLPDAATAGTVTTLLFSMSLTFNGVLATPSSLPGFWIFMYRVSPLTYFIQGWAASGAHNVPITCSSTELAMFNPPPGQTCGQYMAPFLQQAPGYLADPNATANCGYCPLSVADEFLAQSEIYYSQRWRNFGIIWAYIVFNLAAAVVLYYLARVKVWKGSDLSFGKIKARLASIGHIILRGRDDGDVVDESKANTQVALDRKRTNERVY